MDTNILLESGTNELEILEFTLGDNHYGINVAKIREILSYQKVTPVPNTHPSVEGIFMPREVMITVINLKKCLGMEDDGQEGLFIITNFNKLDVAFHVDQVVGIHRVSWNEIIKPDSTINGEDGSVATGVIKMDGKLVVILDFEAIVSSISPETGLRVNDIEQIGERSRSEDPILIAEDSPLLSSLITDCLKKAGYDVIGVTMQIWQDEAETVQEENGGCCGLSAVDDARRVAQVLDIPYYVMNFKKEFRDNVMDYFTNEYLCGRTPNPCIACNRYVKWEALLQRSLSIGADYIATGHYARIEQLANGRYAIANSVTAAKDQTYALYNLTQEQLSHTLMPVGDYTKDQIREIAAKIGLPVAKKKDSQEICFVPDQDYASFIQNETGIVAPKGNFVNTKGEILGTHEGITHYTVGQRRGLGLPMGHRVFVLEIRPETNEVVVGENEEVFAKVVKANKVNYMAIPPLELGEELSCTAKIRYGHKGSPCVIKRTGEDEITCTFPDGVRAPTPGQAVVFYVDGCVGGGGTITEAER